MWQQQQEVCALSRWCVLPERPAGRLMLLAAMCLQHFWLLFLCTAIEVGVMRFVIQSTLAQECPSWWSQQGMGGCLASSMRQPTQTLNEAQGTMPAHPHKHAPRNCAPNDVQANQAVRV